MKPLIIIFPFNLLAHYLRCLVLADVLKEHFEIMFSSGDYDNIVNTHGYKSIHAENYNAINVIEHSHRFDFSWLNLNDTERIFQSQTDLIKRYKPSLVLGDTSYPLKMAAEITSTPFVSLQNGYMSRYYSDIRKLPPIHPAYKYQQKIKPEYFNPIIRFAEKFVFRQIHQPFRTLRKKYGLKTLYDLFAESEGDLTLICDSPSLIPTSNLPISHLYISPLIYHNKKPVNYKYDRKKPLIYVSMGSSGNWKNVSFLNDDHFKEFEIVTSGDLDQVLAGNHIKSFAFVDPDEILPHASLVICHGGNGTVYQALKYNLPILIKPSFFEQYYNLHAVEKNKCGEEITSDVTIALFEIKFWICKKEEGYSTPSAIYNDIINAPVAIRSATERILSLVK